MLARAAAEYGAAAGLGTNYVTADHLGSTRLVTNQTGNIVSLQDYPPFGRGTGEGAPGGGTGGRTVGHRGTSMIGKSQGETEVSRGQ